MPAILILKNGMQIPVKDRLMPAVLWPPSAFLSFISQTTGHKVKVRRSEVMVVEAVSQAEWDERQAATEKARAEQGSRIARPHMVVPAGGNRRS